MRFLIYLLAALLILTVAGAVYFRMVPIPAEDWHVDPQGITPPASPNYAWLAGETATPINAPPLAVAGRLDAIAAAEGADVLAGSAAEGFVSYIVRTSIMGFADVVSIRLEPDGEGTRVHLFSRSRHGWSDLGVNTARAQRWLEAMRGA